MRIKPLLLIAATLTAIGGADWPSSTQAADATDAHLAATGRVPHRAAAFVPGRVLAKFRGATRLPASGPPTRDAPGGPVALSAEAHASLAAIQGRVVRTFAAPGTLLIETGIDTGQAIEALYRSGTVEFAEPDYRVSIHQTPNDARFAKLWGLHNSGQTGGVADADIDAPEAWTLRTDASATLVGVVDTGIDLAHPDLAANLWQNPGEIAGDGLDNDGNGYVDDVYGIDTVNDDSDPDDDHGHGTHVAGTIGAVGNNGIGVAGVAWKARLMALKFLDASGRGSSSDAIAALEYAIAIKTAHGYPRMVLNNSWSGSDFSQALQETIAAARDAGILFVASAGNSGADTDFQPSYPAGYDLSNILSVGASDDTDQAAEFSNYGCGSVDLFAPGVNILSTYRGGGYATLNGTSMAAPHVTGTAALVWSRYPGQNWQAVKRALLNGADARADLAGLASSQARLNLRGSLARSRMNQPVIWGASDFAAGPGSQIRLAGSRFGATPGTVSFNGAPLTVNDWSDEEILATIPLSKTPLGTGLLRVRDAGGVQSRAGHCFTVAFRPQRVGQTLIPHALAAGARVGEDYWILGGLTAWGETGLVERYTPATGRSALDSDWSMPAPVSSAAAAAVGQKIYLVGGSDATEALRIFDTASGTWSSGAPLPTRLSRPAAVALSDGRIYVFGGRDENDEVLNTNHIYDPASDRWSLGAALPTPRSSAAAAEQQTSRLAWVMGGYGASESGLKTVEVYDAVADSWSRRPGLSHRRGGLVGVYEKGQIQALHGGDQEGRADGERFDGTAWHNDIESAQRLIYLTGAVFDGVYLFGGLDDDTWGVSRNIWRLVRP